MSTVRWSDIRDKHVNAIGPADVERGKARLLSQVRAHRLADMRKRRGLTQRQVALAMDVTVGRVSQIERSSAPVHPPAVRPRSRRSAAVRQARSAATNAADTSTGVPLFGQDLSRTTFAAEDHGVNPLIGLSATVTKVPPSAGFASTTPYVVP